MIKGLYAGYQGKIYIYYRGPIQVVLSDVQAGFNMGAKDMAATALRVVLKPKQWTEVAYSYVKEGLENHKGQLFALERDGLVDIYTDEKEVYALKHPQPTTPLATAEVPQQQAEVLPMAKPAQQKYFGMKMFTGENQAPVQLPVQASAGPVQPDFTETLKKQQELMEKQINAMTEMMHAMAKTMNAFSDKLSGKKDEN